jgi:hypothetical protein
MLWCDILDAVPILMYVSNTLLLMLLALVLHAAAALLAAV